MKPFRSLVAGIALGAICICGFAQGQKFDPAMNPAFYKLRRMVDNQPTPEELQQVSGILSELLRSDPGSIPGNVLAARIAIMQGQLAWGKFEPGSLEMAEKFLAVALSGPQPSATALALKGEIHLLRNELPEAKAALDQALAADESNPWVHVRLGDYYAEMHDNRKAVEAYFRVTPFGGEEQRRAFVVAATTGSWYVALPQNLESLRESARKVDELRNPRDSLSIAAWSKIFLYVGALDDALAYGLKAVAVSENFDARQSLANALYAKAADLADRKQDPSEFLQRAAAVPSAPALTICAFSHPSAAVHKLLPIVKGFLETKKETQDTFYASKCGANRTG